MERAARDGSVEAQVLLSALCIRGLANAKSPDQDNKADPLFMADTTSEPDFETAKRWAERATRAGSAEGMALLAYVLLAARIHARSGRGPPALQTVCGRWLPAGPSRLRALAGPRRH